MAESWDTIVIGAGIGGLAAAAKLARAGQHVLVLDRNPHPGGTAYVYHRKGFSFPMGPLGFSNPLRVKKILRDCGDTEDFEFHRIHFRLRAFGLNVPLSYPYEELIDALSKYFPSEKESIGAFFQEVERVTSPTGLIQTMGRSLTSQIWEKRSVAEYLRGLIKEWRLRRILGSLGTREPYSSFPMQAAMWNLMVKEGIWYPREGMQSFCERLVRGVLGHSKQDHGSVRLRSEVRRIRVREGRVSGVAMGDGRILDSRSVISNTDYKSTFLNLLDRSDVPGPWHRAVSEARQTRSILQVCLGVDKRRVDLSSFEEAGRLIYRRDQGDPPTEVEPDWQAERIDPEILARQELEVSLWSREDSNLAPGGAAVIVVRTEVPYSHFAHYRRGHRERLPSYLDYKMQLARAFVREVGALVPGLEKGIVTMDVATPLTFKDQGGRSEGAVAGWSWEYEDSEENYPRELVRTPIRGLFMAGYQAFSAMFIGGIPTAMESGLRAAEAVLREADPMEEVSIPGRV